jgi:hypothetical protein
MANLGAQFTVRRPTRTYVINTKQGPGNFAMVGTRLRRIERLQGAQM